MILIFFSYNLSLKAERIKVHSWIWLLVTMPQLTQLSLLSYGSHACSYSILPHFQLIQKSRSSSAPLEPSLAPCWGFRAFENDHDCSFSWSQCSLSAAFPISILALDTIGFKLKMIPVLVGKDLGKGKGNGHWKDGWKQRRLKGNLKSPGMGGGKKMHDPPMLEISSLCSLTSNAERISDTETCEEPRNLMCFSSSLLSIAIQILCTRNSSLTSI